MIGSDDYVYRAGTFDDDLRRAYSADGIVRTPVRLRFGHPGQAKAMRRHVRRGIRRERRARRGW